MEAIVLAGGRGTRLASVVKDVPKPMAEINGRPFLASLLGYLAKFGVDRVILSTGYKHEIIEDYFGNRFAGMAIEYSREYEPLGTGGAIRDALQKVLADHVLVLNGDTFFQVDLQGMMQAHVGKSCDISIALKQMSRFDRYGTVTFAQERIVGFEEKTYKESGYINAGVYCLAKDVFAGTATAKVFSFENEFLVKKIEELKICPYVSDGYFIDIGIPEDYARAQHELKFHV